MAKLCLHTATLFSGARSLAETAHRKTPLIKVKSDSQGGQVSQDVRKYLEEESALADALAHKWLGVDAGEAGKTGDAVGYLKWAKGELEALKEGKMARFKKGSGGGDVKMKKERSVEELESVSTFLKSYQKVNDSVSRFPVSPEDARTHGKC